jgi:hypothetical protein
MRERLCRVRQGDEEDGVLKKIEAVLTRRVGPFEKE